MHGTAARSLLAATFLATVLVGPAVTSPASAAPGHASGATEAPDPTCPVPRSVTEATWPFATTTPAGVGGGSGATRVAFDPAPPPVTHANPDTDGDGQPDQIEIVDGDLVVTRGSGTLTIEGSSGTTFPGSWTTVSDRAADLDGDGKDELWSNSTTVNGNPAPWNGGIRIVPSWLPDGTYAYEEAALPFYASTVVGDLNDDGLNDLRVPGPSTGYKSFNTVRYASLVGLRARLLHEMYESDDVVAGRADLDGDGLSDTVFHADHTSSGGNASVHLSASGEVVPLGDRPLIASAFLNRADTRTFVVFGFVLPSAFVPEPSQHNASFHLQLRCAAPWTERTTQLLLGRSAGPAERAIVADDSDPRPDLRRWLVAIELRSIEGRTKTVDDRYRWLLGRGADPGAARYWTEALGSRRRTVEHLTATLLGSDERFRRSGSSTAGWADAMYRDILGRPSDPSGRSYWARQAAALGRERAATRFLASPAARQARARALTRLVLDRAPTTSELGPAVAALGAGGEERLLTDLAASDAAYLLGR
jgi:hypothetical protein